ncbi:hypothetical protein ACMDCR_08185 [Labrys okinawensis]|uniref:hypothetical protein n=1 Tax=Labrys okinawensis TaxID=346911 RepID=UPI0039BD184E
MVSQKPASRQKAPAYRISTDPALRLRVDGRDFRPISNEGAVYTFAIPQVFEDLRVVSRSNSLREVADATSEDIRLMGIAIGRIVLRNGTGKREVAIDHPLLTQGLYEPERRETRLWRWTNGEAHLPVSILKYDDKLPTLIEIHVQGQLPGYHLEAAQTPYTEERNDWTGAPAIEGEDWETDALEALLGLSVDFGNGSETDGEEPQPALAPSSSADTRSVGGDGESGRSDGPAMETTENPVITTDSMAMPGNDETPPDNSTAKLQGEIRLENVPAETFSAPNEPGSRADSTTLPEASLMTDGSSAVPAAKSVAGGRKIRTKPLGTVAPPSAAIKS